MGRNITKRKLETYQGEVRNIPREKLETYKGEVRNISMGS